MNKIPFYLLENKQKEGVIKDNEIKENNLNDLNNLVNKLEKEVAKLDKLIDYENFKNEEITKKIYLLNKLRLFLEIKIYESEFENNNPKMKKIIDKLELLNKNIEIIKEYNNLLYNKNRTKALDTLTVVNTIFLPLSLIVGYFGMNFKSMGCPAEKTGILTIKYGQTLVFILMIIVTVFIIYSFKINLIPF